MKRVLFLIAGFALALGFAALPAPVVAGPIDGTSHDFSNLALHPWNTAGYKCQICHTPHGPSTLNKPLWNHKMSAATYSWNSTTTIGGTTLPTNFSTWDGPSKFCLSCHDGTVGVGDLYVNGYGTACASSECITGATNPAKIGPNLTGNHPVGIPYPFGNASNTYNSIAVGAGVDTSSASYVASPTVVRLYNDNAGKVSAGAVAGKSGIECGSCHDPHNNSKTMFLRDAQATICQRCHAF